jgi:CLN3 protein
MTIGFLIIAFVATFSHSKSAFFIALISSVMLGISSALGEAINLGFIKGFPSEVIGYYGSGTGFAGIFGSGILLLLKAAGLSDG